MSQETQPTIPQQPDGESKESIVSSRGDSILVFAKRTALLGVIAVGISFVGMAGNLAGFFLCYTDAHGFNNSLFVCRIFEIITPLAVAFYIGAFLLLLSGFSWTFVFLSKKIGAKIASVLTFFLILLIIAALPGGTGKTEGYLFIVAMILVVVEHTTGVFRLIWSKIYNN